MKKILLSALLGVSTYMFGQLTCATATAITTNGSYTCPALTGTYVGTCAGSGQATSPKAIWYSYTATANGEVTISSNLPQNDGATKSNDTRLSIITGTCAALTCYNGNDDVSATNYLSQLTFPVSAGTTYYISWDNRWSSLGFDFTFNFAAPSCIKPNDFSVNAATNITLNSATTSWSAAIGSPASYDVQHGASGFTLGTGTIQNTTTTSANLSNLPTGGNHSYYVRSNCGATQSSWTGPFSIFLAKKAPYSNSFESPDYAAGFGGTGWSLNEGAAYAQQGTICYFSNTSTTAVSNSQLYSRALSFTAGAPITLNFWTRVAGTASGTIKVYYNTQKSLTGATQIGTNIAVSGTTYVQQTQNFSVPTTGIYYLIFSNESAITATSTSLLLDSVSLSSTLGTNETTYDDILLSVYPNPVKDMLNIKTDKKIKSVQIFDASGKLINARLNGNQIDVKSLSPGNYIINIETNSGKTSEKFIKK